MTNKKIALIGFGGTIAMVLNEAGFLVPAQSAEELVSQAPSLKNLDAQLDVIQLQNKDSTNLTPEDWQLLIAKLVELYEHYDGFIVTHGTDTMTHTATAVAFAFGRQLTKPIIFTGAQTPMSELGTDARTNLECSAKVIMRAIDESINEVMIVFGGRILRASRAIKKSEIDFDAFDSPAFPNIGSIPASGMTFTAQAGSLFDKKSVYSTPVVKDKFISNIMTIETKPGLEPELVREVAFSPRCAAIILRSFGAGIVPSEGKYSLGPAIKEIVNAGKPVIVSTMFVGGRAVQTSYESGQTAIQAGAILAGDMTPVATEVKLSWLMGQGMTDLAEIKAAMLHSYVGEIS